MSGLLLYNNIWSSYDHMMIIMIIWWHWHIARIMSSHKIYGLCGLKHHIVEMRGDVTNAWRQTNKRRTTEDRATQPMDAGGWVSQFWQLWRLWQLIKWNKMNHFDVVVFSHYLQPSKRHNLKFLVFILVKYFWLYRVLFSTA